MPLRDHFRPPIDNRRHCEGFHATWPVMIVAALRPRLPHRYYAEPRVHSGTSVEIDVSTFESEEEETLTGGSGIGNGDGAATAVWAPVQPSLRIAADLPGQDVYEVLVFDEKRRRRLVAAVEIVSPANQDRPEHRRAFASKCAGLLRERVGVVIVDLVTTRTHNLYVELHHLLGTSDPAMLPEPPGLYAAACRFTKNSDAWALEAWTQPLALRQPLPTMPLWLADNLAVPLELEASYEQSCQLLGIA